MFHLSQRSTHPSYLIFCLVIGSATLFLVHLRNWSRIKLNIRKYFQDTREREVNKNTTTTTTTTQQHQQPQRVGALSPMPTCLGIAGPGKDTHGTPVLLRRKAVGGPTKSMTTNTMRVETQNVHGHAMPRMPLAHLDILMCHDVGVVELVR